MDRRCTIVYGLTYEEDYTSLINYYVRQKFTSKKLNYKHFCTYLAFSTHILETHMTKPLPDSINDMLVLDGEKVPIIGIKLLQEERSHENIATILRTNPDITTIVYVDCTPLTAYATCNPDFNHIVKYIVMKIYEIALRNNKCIYRVVFRDWGTSTVRGYDTTDIGDVRDTVYKCVQFGRFRFDITKILAYCMVKRGKAIEPLLENITIEYNIKHEDLSEQYEWIKFKSHINKLHGTECRNLME